MDQQPRTRLVVRKIGPAAELEQLLDSKWLPFLEYHEFVKGKEQKDKTTFSRLYLCFKTTCIAELLDFVKQFKPQKSVEFAPYQRIQSLAKVDERMNTLEKSVEYLDFLKHLENPQSDLELEQQQREDLLENSKPKTTPLLEGLKKLIEKKALMKHARKVFDQDLAGATGVPTPKKSKPKRKKKKKPAVLAVTNVILATDYPSLSLSNGPSIGISKAPTTGRGEQREYKFTVTKKDGSLRSIGRSS